MIAGAERFPGVQRLSRGQIAGLVRRAAEWTLADRQKDRRAAKNAQRRFFYHVDKLDLHPVERIAVQLAAVQLAAVELEATSIEWEIE